jgi:hypothetical protein
LIFVGLEISESNSETRAATIQTALSLEMNLQRTLVDHAAVWDKVINGEDLNQGWEARTGIILFNLVMTESENRFHQYNSGYLAEESWEGRLTSLDPMVRLPIFGLWRSSPGALNHSTDFLRLLDELGARVSAE